MSAFHLDSADIPPVLTARRTVRFYTTAPVPEALVRALLDAALVAPSAHNAQSTRLVAIASPHLKRRLADRMGGSTKISEKWRRRRSSFAAERAGCEPDSRS